MVVHHTATLPHPSLEESDRMNSSPLPIQQRDVITKNIIMQVVLLKNRKEGQTDLHYKFQEDVAVVGEDCGFGKVEAECLSCWFLLLNSPTCLSYTRLVETFRQT